MSTEQPLAARREQAVKQWLNAVYAMYPFETSGFMRTQEDRFANPVGHVTRQAAGTLYDAVTGADVEPKVVEAALAALTRVRAVQDLRPEQATGALFLLKPVLRELLLVDMLAAGGFQDFLDMESRVDSLALMAFAMYTADREVVFAERVAEQRRSTAQLAKWAERRGYAGSAEQGGGQEPDAAARTS